MKTIRKTHTVTHSSNYLYWVAIVINIAVIVIQALIINYLYHLDSKNCKCAADYRRIYIIVFLTLFVVDTILMSIPPVYKLISSNMTIYSIIRLILFIATIINIVFVYDYIRELKERRCKCSESVYRTILYVENIIEISGIALIVFGGLFFGVHLSIMKSR